MTTPDIAAPRSCPLCDALLQQSAREHGPHAALELLSDKPWAQALGKRAAGGLETYVCRDCGKERIRDTSPTYSARWM